MFVARFRCLYGLVALLFLFSFLSGCAGTPQTDALYELNYSVRYPATELTQTVFFPQQEYQCGPAALATVLNESGIVVTPAQLKPLVYIPKKKGSLQVELVAATRRFDRVPYLIQPKLQHLLDEVKAGNPVLVFQNLGLDWYTQWHFAVVVGFDLKQEQIILRSGKEKQHRVSVSLFERTWARAGYWGLRILKPGEFPVNVDELRYFTALVSLERLKKWPTLITSYHSAVEKWPNSQNFNMGLANSYYSNAEFVKAKKRYLHIINKWPNYAPAFNNLAQISIDVNDLEQALKYAQKAVSIAGVHQHIYKQTLSEIQIKLEK